MSSSLQASSSSTPNFQPIFEKVLKDYKKKTGIDLAAHPLAAEINACNSSESILAVLQGKANELNRFRSSDDRLTKWLKPTVNILNALSVTLGEGTGLAFLPTRIILSGIGILLVAAKSTVTSRDVLVELFDRIESLFRHLETYTEVPPTQARMDVLVKIMAEVLLIFATATKGVKERRTKTILKKLAGMNDIEDALQRFRKLEEGELLMVIAQVSRETKSDAKDGISKETVKRMDASDSSSLDEGVLSPEEPPAPAPEPSHPGSWQSVHQRDGFTRTGKKPEAHSPGPVIETPMWPPPGSFPDRAQAADSWATWQVQPGEYTPPPSEFMILAPEGPPQPRGLFGPRSPRSSNEALSLDELPEPPRPGAWRSVHQRGGFRHTRKKPEAWPPGRPAWATWQGKLQAGLEYTSPEGPPQFFRPCSPRSSIEELPTPFRPGTRRPVHQRRVFSRAHKKSEAHPLAEPLSRVQAAGSWENWQGKFQPGEYTPPPSEPMILAPEVPSQPHGLFGPRSPRSSIYEPPAPVYQQRVFRRARKTSEVQTPGGVIETPMGTSPASPPGRVRRRAVHSGRKI
ncbi:hypothetical protein EDB85DRAFT_2289280 [Lactarius pseudohatsudake]|nr:hypothetical protein EDB85DRAFT_2289280 [Lactarius pseudohatsudake]